MEQSLRDDNATLRAQLAEAQDYIELQKYRRVELSKMLKIGFWEWDEQAQAPISYSPEMADVLGLDKARLEKLFHNPGDFKRILHPDDLALYQENLDARKLLTPGSSCVFAKLANHCDCSATLFSVLGVGRAASACASSAKRVRLNFI